jgi:phosphate ABC transporter phosphate-binding protein
MSSCIPKEGLVKLRRRVALAIATLAMVSVTANPVLAADPVLPTGEVGDLAGSGATFPALLYKSWQSAFARKYPAVFDAGGDKTKGLVASYNAVGSGAGVRNFYGADARKATQLFSGSDALLTNAEKTAVTAGVGDYVMIPTSLGPVAVVYNLPGLKQKTSATSKTTRAATLYLDGKVIGNIYAGVIKKWNDPAIKKLNPLITNLPNLSIEPVYRSDGSGTTFIWTSYLNKVSSVWKAALGDAPSKTLADKIATMASKSTAVGAPGNEGVSVTVAGDRGSIGYVELGYALQLGLKYAWVRTADSPRAYYVAPSVSGAQAAAAVAYKAGTADDPINPGTVESKTFYQPVHQKGATSYPISGYTWVLLYKDYKGGNDPGFGKTQALIAFLAWALSPTGGQAVMSRLGYAPLPASTAAQAIAQLHLIKYNGVVVWP